MAARLRNLSDQNAWPTEHLKSLLEAIDEELERRAEEGEAVDAQGFESALRNELSQFLSSRE
jgi:hypothetical protein